MRYSECEAPNYSKQSVTDLLGKIATFKDDFSAGYYAAEVSSAITVEIYYKASIAVTAHLTNSAVRVSQICRIWPLENIRFLDSYIKYMESVRKNLYSGIISQILCMGQFQ